LVNSISLPLSSEDDPLSGHPPQPIKGLSDSTLNVIREGLERVVADPDGTAHETVFFSELAIVGKTGTAETGGDFPDHAWFAGYAPADTPKAAFVVVLEHAGHGGLAAAPVARHLVERMQQLGYFQRTLRQTLR
jgi:penicillin-binding protein 2